MKKIVKAAASVFLSAAILSSTLPLGGFVIEASAETKLSTKLTYEKDGTAVLEIIASEWENQVRYTTDGSVPTMESRLYFSPLEITEKTTIRIAEFDDGTKKSGIKKTVKPKTAPVTFAVEQDYDEDKAYITLECATLGAKIYYTTDGSKPSEDSPIYLGPVEIDEKTKIRARAYCDGYATKTTYSKTVKIEEEPEQEDDEVEVKDTEKDIEDNEVAPAKEPENKEEKETEKEPEQQEEKQVVIEKDSEEKSVSEKVHYSISYNAEKGITYIKLTGANGNNIIRYTKDGSAVSKSSKKYSSRIKFTEPGVLRAKEYTKSGELVATLKINVTLKCASVEYSCIDMATGTKTIEMSSDTEGATIYYTLDGSVPTAERGTLYSYPLVLGDASFVRAIAVKDDYKNSIVSDQLAGTVPYYIRDFNFDDPIYKETADALNVIRVANGKNAVVLDEKLTMAACARAKELSVYFDHTRPTGSKYTSVFGEYGVDPVFASEVIAGKNSSPQEFINEVMELNSNKNILLSNGYQHNKIGIGYYENGRTNYWVVLLIRDETM